VKKTYTKNLFLRKFRVKDITEHYINSLNAREVVALTNAAKKKWDIKSVEQYVMKSNKRNISLLVGIFLKSSGRHIGNIRLSGFDSYHSRVELGIMIFDMSQWGKGYGLESLEAVVEHIFKELKLHRICADYYSVNKRSTRLFQKAGFIIEGVFKDHFKLNGKYVDSIRVAKLNKR